MPNELLAGHFWADVARLWTHITVGQLEPGPSKDLREIGGVFVEPLGDFSVLRVHLHGHIGIGHDGVEANRGVLNVNGLVVFLDVDGLPLPRTGRALLKFPFVIKKKVEVAVIPLCGMCGPCALNTACDGIATNATAFFV